MFAVFLMTYCLKIASRCL